MSQFQILTCRSLQRHSFKIDSGANFGLENLCSSACGSPLVGLQAGGVGSRLVGCQGEDEVDNACHQYDGGTVDHGSNEADIVFLI